MSSHVLDLYSSLILNIILYTLPGVEILIRCRTIRCIVTCFRFRRFHILYSQRLFLFSVPPILFLLTLFFLMIAATFLISLIFHSIHHIIPSEHSILVDNLYRSSLFPYLNLFPYLHCSISNHLSMLFSYFYLPAFPHTYIFSPVHT